MAAKSKVYSNTILNQLFGSGTPATLFVALYTSLPSPDGTGGTEVTGGSYARAAVTNNTTNFPASTNAQSSNGTAITFAQATASWGTIVGVGILSASTGGTLYYFGALAASRTVGNGDTFSFAATQLVISES